MKKLKRITLIISFILIPILGIKIYFEIENSFLMNTYDTITTSQIHSSVAHKTLPQNGYDIHYFVSGSNHSKTILFLHPAFSDHRAFDLQIDHFAQKYRVITIDLIGHGLSKAGKSKDQIDASASHILQILDLEEVEKTHLIGTSMGSLVAQHFAFQHPEKVHSLTALGGYNIHKENKEVEKAQRTSNLGLIFRALFSMKSFRRKTAEITCFTPKGKSLFYQSSSLYERKSFLVMQGFQNIIKNRDSIPIPYPILILTGVHDISLALKMSNQWHADLENSTSIVIDNAGHCAHMDQPEEFNTLVENFILESESNH